MKHFNRLTASFLLIGGVKIFPCQEDGPSAKAPYTRRGFKEATVDIEAMKSWLSSYPDAVWGVPCAMNGVLVFDADRHGKGDGVSNIMHLFEEHKFDCRSVPIVETPRGGYHFYFRRPAMLGRTKSKLCEAVDVRDNAYVIAPECTMRDGGHYKLIEGTVTQLAECIAKRSLIEPPAWLIQMLLHPPAPPPEDFLEPVDDEAVWTKMKAIIGAALRAEEGNRNQFLFWAACRFAEMVQGELVTREFAEALLVEAGARLGLSMRETRATVASGLRNASEGDRDAC